MPTSFLEIVQLPTGEFALRRSDDENTPLVRIRFSQEAKDMLQDNDLAVAKAMITAGIEAAGTANGDIGEVDLEEEDADTMPPAYNQTVH
ncbi:hypothetical protein DES49_2210 [Halospina denitrificans]|uniref:Uncharacterized protein n=1 Tax=Halospina denitrificans TaxID=332522 RepID=A0A4R7JML2_9GAMM|nr:hypothetical protein [Halospina denitrificans]TDT39292.1 hypothetical protein DES49_2210 [Halospina denitrificans]